MSFIQTLALVGLVASPAAAFWRLPCKAPLVVERADPIVNPGAMSGHVHTIMGGNGFDFTMDYASTQASTCTSCTVHGDFSNYWTPTLWFKHQNGSFESVKQVGGATVYYLQRKANDTEKLQAFPEGFRMIAGDPFKRSGGSDHASQAVSYNCLDYKLSPPHPETNNFPNYNCPDGLRSQIFFPSCWDGKNLDSPDHKSHMSYPVENYNGGSCPDTHPVHLISIFYEIIWDTNKFASMWTGSQQPFMWSMGDPTGYGFHGDFVMGWDRSLLQRAVDTCTNNSGRVEDCGEFTLYPDTTAQQCSKASKINEAVSGVLDALPGCNPVQSGPAAAAPVKDCASGGKVSGGGSSTSSASSSSTTSNASSLASSTSVSSGKSTGSSSKPSLSTTSTKLSLSTTSAIYVGGQFYGNASTSTTVHTSTYKLTSTASSSQSTQVAPISSSPTPSRSAALPYESSLIPGFNSNNGGNKNCAAGPATITITETSISTVYAVPTNAATTINAVNSTSDSTSKPSSSSKPQSSPTSKIPSGVAKPTGTGVGAARPTEWAGWRRHAGAHGRGVLQQRQFRS